MAVMPLVGLWFLATIPDDSRSWLLGGSVAMTMFLTVAVGASTLLGLYAVIAMMWQRVVIAKATAALLLALAFAATAAGEFVREGARKPYTIRQTLYSNAISPEQVAGLRAIGAVADDPYPLPDQDRIPTPELVRGAKVFRRLCAVCHTVDGVNGVGHLTASWDDDQLRMNIAKLQLTKPFMPPFAGNAEDVDALVRWLRWEQAGRPARVETIRDESVLERIAKWLDEAGTEPGSEGVR
jgi:mono/diheme cytochrome c family protein